MVKAFTKGLLLTQIPSLVAGANTPVYKDAKAPVEKRVKDLLGRMTIEDKMAQLIQGISFLLWQVIVSMAHKPFSRRYHELDEPNLWRIQLYRSGYEHGNEGGQLLWY